MDFKTVEHWDEDLWNKAKVVYFEAFAEKGAKPEKIIRNMFRKGICYLHVVEKDAKIVGMALTGKLKKADALLIDYLAVSTQARGEGIGHQLLEYLVHWSLTEGNFSSLLIEVESEPTTENLARIHFWLGLGFTLTDYVHHYIWVPETYQAMYRKLKATASIPCAGEQLFRLIAHFHKSSYQGA